MRVIFLAVLFLGFSPLSAFAVDESCKTLGDNLYDCIPFDCKTPDPNNPKQMITNVIKGYDKEGECVHEQSSASGDKLVCSYSPESRKFLGMKMKKSGSDIASIENASEFEENLMADIFQNECEVISKNGTRRSATEAGESGDSGSFGDNSSDDTDDAATDEVDDQPAVSDVSSGEGDVDGAMDEPEHHPAKGVENNGNLLDEK